MWRDESLHNLSSAVTEEETVTKSSSVGSRQQVAQSRCLKEVGTVKIQERDANQKTYFY